jgi:hypothetical protein
MEWKIVVMVIVSGLVSKTKKPTAGLIRRWACALFRFG